MPSGNNLDIKKMVKQFGPVKRIAMHPDYYKKLRATAALNQEGPSTFKSVPIVDSELVDDWWPLFE